MKQSSNSNDRQDQDSSNSPSSHDQALVDKLGEQKLKYDGWGIAWRSFWAAGRNAAIAFVCFGFPAAMPFVCGTAGFAYSAKLLWPSMKFTYENKKISPIKKVVQFLGYAALIAASTAAATIVGYKLGTFLERVSNAFGVLLDSTPKLFGLKDMLANFGSTIAIKTGITVASSVGGLSFLNTFASLAKKNKQAIHEAKVQQETLKQAQIIAQQQEKKLAPDKQLSEMKNAKMENIKQQDAKLLVEIKQQVSSKRSSGPVLSTKSDQLRSRVSKNQHQLY